MPVSLADQKPKWSNTQKFDLMHLSNRDISDHVIRMGIRVLELNTMEDSIKGWAQEVKKKKVSHFSWKYHDFCNDKDVHV